jgi:hypothetical protein
MLEDQGLDNDSREFLLEIYTQANGDANKQVSMYTVGAKLGLDKSAASKRAQDLIGLGFIDVRTLSGGVALTDNGIEAALAFGATDSSAPDAPRLGVDPVVSEAICAEIETMVGGIKSCIGDLGLEFVQLEEMMADLKTVDAQLASPRPKNEIMRICLKGLAGMLQGSETAPLKKRLVNFLAI